MANSMTSLAPPAPTKSSIIAGAKTLWEWLSEAPTWIKSLSPSGADSYGDAADIVLTDTSNFSLYSSSSALRVRRQGKIVEIHGSLACKSAGFITSIDERVFAQLPQECAPSFTRYYRMHGGTNASWLLTVKTNGDLCASRYSDTQPAGTWLPMSASFIVG